MAVTVVLLSAGYATRLYPLTKDKPKALLPLGGGTILDAVLDSVKTVPSVFKRVLVTNPRFAGQFQAWQKTPASALAKGGPGGSAPVEVVDDGTETVETRLGAIRDLELAARLAGPQDDLLVIGTDNLFHWPLGDFVKAAQRHAPKPTIALWEAPSRQAATQFGVVIRDQTGRITGFAEKSPSPPSAEVALCVYYFPAAMRGDIRTFLDGGGNADAPGYFIEWLVGRGIVYGEMMPGAWYDIGSLESYQTVQKKWT